MANAKAPPAVKAKPSDKKTGRPTEFSLELAKQICVRLANGETLTSICKNADMPARHTVNRWLLVDDGPDFDTFKNVYARARQLQADTWADECLDISDDNSADWKEGRAGGLSPNNEVVARSKLRVDTRLRLAAISNPLKYAAEAANKAVKDSSEKEADKGDGSTQVNITGGLPDE